MRILHISLNAGVPQLALDRALKSLGEYRAIDWMAARRRWGTLGATRAIEFMVKEHNPELTFCQVQTEGIVTPRLAEMIPGVKLNWTGDVRDPTPRWYFDLADHFDATLFTNLHDVDALRRENKRSDYLQIGFDPLVYRPDGPARSVPPIIFMGNNYGHQFPLSADRRQMVQALRLRYGRQFAVYGFGWDPPADGNMNASPQAEAQVYRGAKIAIVQNHFRYPRFSSDRILRAMGCGVMCLTQHYPLVELEHAPGLDHRTWESLGDLFKLVDYYLAHDDERRKIAESGCRNVHARHTWDARVGEIRSIYESIKGGT